MKRAIQKILAWLMAVLMITGSMPLEALATETTSENTFAYTVTSDTSAAQSEAGNTIYMKPGETQEIKVQDDASYGISATSSDSDVVSAEASNAWPRDGLYLILGAKDIGESTVTVYKEGSTVCGTYTVKVMGSIPPAGIKITSGNISVPLNHFGSASASFAPDNADVPEELSIVYESDTPSVATVENGTVIPHEEGTAIITARAVDGNGNPYPSDCQFTDSVTVTVTGASEEDETTHFLTIQVGETSTVRMTTKANWSNDQPYATVTLTNSQPADMTYAWDGQSGMLDVTIAAKEVGHTIVKADTPQQNAVLYVTVIPRVMPDTISIVAPKDESGNFSLMEGKSADVTLTYAPDNAHFEDLIFEWSSNHPEYATVADDGTVTVTGVAPGPATITAHALTKDGQPYYKADGTELTATLDVTVTVNPNLIVTGPEYLMVNDSAQLTVNKSDVIWVSSNENILTVDENGLVTAKGVGTATITATYKKDWSISGEISIDVLDEVPVSFTAYAFVTNEYWKTLSLRLPGDASPVSVSSIVPYRITKDGETAEFIPLVRAVPLKGTDDGTWYFDNTAYPAIKYLKYDNGVQYSDDGENWTPVPDGHSICCYYDEVHKGKDEEGQTDVDIDILLSDWPWNPDKTAEINASRHVLYIDVQVAPEIIHDLRGERIRKGGAMYYDSGTQGGGRVGRISFNSLGSEWEVIRVEIEHCWDALPGQESWEGKEISPYASATSKGWDDSDNYITYNKEDDDRWEAYRVTAIVVPRSFTVTYDGNGHTGGVVPVDEDNPYYKGEPVTVLNGLPIRSGYAFAGWKSSYDGEIYYRGNTFTMPAANVVLKAQWVPENYAITYIPVPAQGGSVSLPSELANVESEAASLQGSTAIPNEDDGWTFKGWYSADPRNLSEADQAAILLTEKKEFKPETTAAATYYAYFVQDTVTTNPSLAVTKTVAGETKTGVATNAPYKTGDVLTYTVEVTNTGDVAITNITLTDSLVSARNITNVTPSSFDLEAGDSNSFTYTYTVQESDLGENGQGMIENTAQATGEGPNGSVSSNEVTVTVTTKDKNPSLDIDKKASAPADGKAFMAGETVEYTVDVTNNGNVTISGISLLDSRVSTDKLSNANGLNPQDFTLAPGESATFTYTYTVKQSDMRLNCTSTIRNTATATAQDPTNPTDPDDKITVFDDEDITIAAAKVGLEVTKEIVNSNSAPFNKGETITYKVTVTNPGNLDLTDVTLTDKFGGKNLTSITAGEGTRLERNGDTLKLAPSSGTENGGWEFTLPASSTMAFTYTYIVSEDDLGSHGAAGEIKNTVTAKASDPTNPHVCKFNKQWDVTANTYTKITAKKVWDDGESSVTRTHPTIDLVLTNEADTTEKHTTPLSNGTTVATWYVPAGSYTLSETLPDDCEYAQYGDIVKCTDEGAETDGYTFVVTNKLKDDENPQNPNKVKTNGTTYVTINGEQTQQVAVGGTIVHTITYYNHLGTQAKVTVKDVLPVGLDFDETNAQNTPGYTYNPSERTVTWEIMTDPRTQGSVTVATKVTQSAIENAADKANPTVVNTANVSIGGSYDCTPVTDPTPVYHPALEVTKTATQVQKADGTGPFTYDETVVTAGDTITYKVTVTNTGNVDLTGITLTDAFGGQSTAGIKAGNGTNVKKLEGENNKYQLSPSEGANADGTFNLAKGGSKDFTYTYTVVKEDLGTNGKAGSIQNVATATAPDPRDPDEPDITHEDDFDVETETVITVTKEWKNDRAELRPATITLRLWKNGTEEIKHATLDIEKNEDTVTWTVPVEENATYTVTEDAINRVVEQDGTLVNAAYSSEVTGSYPTFTVTNTLKPDEDAPNPTKTVSSADYVKIDGVSNGMVAVGGTITYKIHYYNHFAEAAKVTVTDTLKKGLDFESADKGGEYDKATRTVTWELKDVPALTEGDVTLTVSVNSDALTGDDGNVLANPSVKNLANLTIDNGKVQVDKTTVEVSTPVYHPALSVTKRVLGIAKDSGYESAEPYTEGQTITYEVTVTNTGNVDLKNITVKDAFGGKNPAGIVAGDGTKVNKLEGENNKYQLSPSEQDANADADKFNLAIGASKVFTYTYTVVKDDLGKDGKAGSISNAATASAPDPSDPSDPSDPDDPDDPIEDEDEKTVETKTVITAKKVWVDGGRTDLRPNEIAFLLVKVSADDTAKETVIRNTLATNIDDEVTWIVPALTEGHYTVEEVAAWLDGATYTSSLDDTNYRAADAAEGSEATQHYTFTITNTLKGDDDPTEPTKTKMKNGTDYVTAYVNGVKNEEMVPVGGTITYKITYKNHLAEAATVTITDKLEAGLTYEGGAAKDSTLDADSQTITYDADKHTVTWVLKDVPALKEGFVTLTVSVNENALNGNDAADAVVKNAANLTIQPGEGKPISQETVTDETPVSNAKLAVTKSVTQVVRNVNGVETTIPYDENNPTIVTTDDVITYQVTVKNIGNIDLQNITLKDAFGGKNPAGIVAGDGTSITGPADGGYQLSPTTGANADGTFDLKKGETATFTYTYTVVEADLGKDGSAGSIKNAATATAKNPNDPDHDIEKESEEEVPTETSLTIQKVWVDNGYTEQRKTVALELQRKGANGLIESYPISLSVNDAKADDSDTWETVWTGAGLNAGETFTLIETEATKNLLKDYYDSSVSGFTVTNTLMTGGEVPPVKSAEPLNYVTAITNVNGTTTEKMVRAGDTIRYTISYYNHLSDKATVTLVDTLQTGLELVPVNPVTKPDGVADSDWSYVAKDGTVTMTITNVAPRSSGTVTLTVTVTKEAIENAIATTGKKLLNKASLTITDGTTTYTKDTNEVDTPVYAPALTVKKEALGVANGTGYTTKDPYFEGDVITYRVTVTNSGNVTVKNINVIDTVNRDASTARTMPLVDEKNTNVTLAPGDSASIEYTYKVQKTDAEQGTIYNEAYATGTPVVTPDDPNNPVDPEQVTSKPADETVNTHQKYEITIAANSGEFPYDGIEHTVSGFAYVEYDGQQQKLTNPTEVKVVIDGKTYTVTGVSATVSATHVMLTDGKLTGHPNTITIDDPNVGMHVWDDQDVDVTTQFDIHRVNGALTIKPRKIWLISASAEKEYNGEPLTAHSVKDFDNKDGTGNGGSGFVGTDGAEYDVTGSQTLIGQSPNYFFYELNDSTYSADYDITPLNGMLTVTGNDPIDPVKTHDEDWYKTNPAVLDEEVEFTITVKNITDKELTNITVTDNTAKLVEVAPADTSFTQSDEHTLTIDKLAAGASIAITATCKASADDILAGAVKNTATVKVEGYTKEYTRNDEIPTVPSAPALNVVKTVLGVLKDGQTDASEANCEKKTAYTVGDTVYYQVTVTNTGNVTLNDVVFNDTLNNNKTLKTDTIAELAPEASQTYIYSYTVQYTENVKDLGVDGKYGVLTNTAKATAPDPTDSTKPNITGNDEKTINTAIVLTITANDNEVEYDGKPHGAKVGDPYTAEGLMSGDTLEGVTVRGEQTNVGEYLGELDPNPKTSNEVRVLRGEEKQDVTDEYYIVYEKGKLTITGCPVKPEKTHETLDNNDVAELGDTVRFIITVTNVSKDVVKDVVVTDDNATIIDGQGYKKVDDHTAQIASLDVGASVKVYAERLITEADIVYDKLHNEATVKTNNGSVTVYHDVTTEKPDPKLKVEKNVLGVLNGKDYATKDVYTAGDTVYYQVTVKNTGNLTIRDIRLSDELRGVELVSAQKDGSKDALDINSFILKPEESATCIYRYTVAVEDLGSNGKLGKVNNHAVATGTPDLPPDTPDIPDKTTGDDEKTIDTAIKITIKANDNTVDYDGKPHGKNEDDPYTYNDGDLEKNHTLVEESVKVSGEETKVGEYPDKLVPSGLKVVDEKGDDVTDHYYPIYVEGDLKILTPHLTVSKTMPEENNVVRAGEIITYTVKVLNAYHPQGAVAKNVVVKESLPANATLIKAEATKGSFNKATGLWTVGDLAVSGAAAPRFETLTLTMRVNSDVKTGDKVINHVAATCDNPDPDEETPEDETTSEVKNPHLAIEKTIVEPAANKQKERVVRTGDTVVYEIVVTNDGAATATNVIVKDTLPKGLKADGAQPLSWTIPELGVGKQVTLSVRATVTDTSVEGKIAGNFVAITSENDTPSDPDDPDRTDETEEITVRNPKLVIEKVVDKQYVYSSKHVHYTITVTNTGAAEAKNVTVKDSLPAGLAFDSATVNGKKAVVKNDIYQIGNLGVGKSAEIVISAKVTAAGGTTISPNVAVVTGWDDKPIPEKDRPRDESEEVEVLNVRVFFFDWDGTLIAVRTLPYGGSTVPPADPEREGWDFSHWDGVWRNVIQDQYVYARYTPRKPEEPHDAQEPIPGEHYGIILDAEIPLAGGYMSTVGDCFD